MKFFTVNDVLFVLKSLIEGTRKNHRVEMDLTCTPNLWFSAKKKKKKRIFTHVHPSLSLFRLAYYTDVLVQCMFQKYVQTLNWYV